MIVHGNVLTQEHQGHPSALVCCVCCMTSVYDLQLDKSVSHQHLEHFSASMTDRGSRMYGPMRMGGKPVKLRLTLLVTCPGTTGLEKSLYDGRGFTCYQNTHQAGNGKVTASRTHTHAHIQTGLLGTWTLFMSANDQYTCH